MTLRRTEDSRSSLDPSLYPAIPASNITHNPRPQVTTTQGLVLAPSAEQTASTSSNPIYPQFLLIGDSITQFSTLTLQAQLSTAYIRRLDVVNRGFSGYTSVLGLQAIRNLYPATFPSLLPRVQLATVFFGANDAVRPGYAQHIDRERYLDTLEEILRCDVLRGAGILLITPPPVNEWQFDEVGRQQRMAGVTGGYVQGLLDKFAGRSDVCVVDVWKAMMEACGWSDNMGRQCCQQPGLPPASQTSFKHIPGCIHLREGRIGNAEHELSDFLFDGLHLTTLGYDVLFKEVMRCIHEAVPHCAPERLPMVLADWKDLLQ